MAPKREFGSYEEFFGFYVQQHSDPVNRALHATGLTLGLLTAATALASRKPRWMLLGLPIGYAFAWTGHFVFQKNRPATFGHPFWSFISDFRMVGLMAAGQLGPWLKKGDEHDALGRQTTAQDLAPQGRGWFSEA